MGMDLVNEFRDFHFSLYGWENVLALAEMYGWRPAGTLPPQPEAVGEPAGAWNGNYFLNDGQTVTAEDAGNLADALERALADIPNHDAAGHKTTKVKTWTGVVQTVLPGAKISPLEALSGPHKSSVREFIAFCRQGSFEVW